MATNESRALNWLTHLKQGIMVEAEGGTWSLSGRSSLAMTKSEFGWKGNRDKILALLEAEIEIARKKL